MSSKQPVVVSASGKHTATLIFLHGLGDTGHGWASSLADVRPSYVKIVCPTAQTMPVTLNSGILLIIIRERMYKKVICQVYIYVSSKLNLKVTT